MTVPAEPDGGSRSSPNPTLVLRAAHNLAAWHTVSLAPLGVPIEADDVLWTARLTTGSIYYSAITLASVGRGEHRTQVYGRIDGAPGCQPDAPATVVCDSFDELDPDAIGLVSTGTGHWFARRAIDAVALPARTSIPGLTIAPLPDATSLAAAEVLACEAFGQPPPLSPLRIHPAAILDDPHLVVLGAWLRGDLVGMAMAVDHAGVLGLYGVAVAEAHRRSGIGTALVAQALRWRPGLTSVLQPTELAAELYGQLGYTDVGRYAVLRAPGAVPDPVPGWSVEEVQHPLGRAPDHGPVT